MQAAKTAKKKPPPRNTNPMITLKTSASGFIGFVLFVMFVMFVMFSMISVVVMFSMLGMIGGLFNEIWNGA